MFFFVIITGIFPELGNTSAFTNISFPYMKYTCVLTGFHYKPRRYMYVLYIYTSTHTYYMQVWIIKTIVMNLYFSVIFKIIIIPVRSSQNSFLSIKTRTFQLSSSRLAISLLLYVFKAH